MVTLNLTLHMTDSLLGSASAVRTAAGAHPLHDEDVDCPHKCRAQQLLALQKSQPIHDVVDARLQLCLLRAAGGGRILRVLRAKGQPLG